MNQVDDDAYATSNTAPTLKTVRTVVAPSQTTTKHARVFGQCCKAMIHAGTRSLLLPLFAIAATMSAMCEAAAVAPSAKTDLEKLLSEESSNTYKSRFPVICNSAKCFNFVEILLQLRFLIIIPLFIIVVATRSRNSATAVEVDEQGVAGDLDSSVSVDQFFYQAITAVPPYEDKSFEELRLDDYLAGNKGMKCEDKKILLAKEV